LSSPNSIAIIGCTTIHHRAVNLCAMSEPPSHDELVEELQRGLTNYFIRAYDDLTIEGLRETTEKFSAEVIEEAIVTSNWLPAVLGHENVTLEIVTYLVDLAPTAVSTVERKSETSIFSDSSRVGSLPLHIACDKRNCPTSVIKFLLEKYPSAAGHSWTAGGRGKSHGYPLHRYLMRAIPREAWYEADRETGELESEEPAIPGQELDYNIVEMLVTACPEVLTATIGLGSPLNILCQGCTVTLALAKLLTDEDQKCFEVDDWHAEFPMRNLLRNKHVDSFPTDVFRYFAQCSPSSLRKQKPIDDDDDQLGAMFTDTLLHVACSNPKISVEAIQLIVDECPHMVREEYAYGGFLPLHNLCSNEDLDDEKSMDILRILVDEFPESVATSVGIPHSSMPKWCSKERGENDLPIHFACQYKSLDFCRYLIERYPISVSKWQLHYRHEEKFIGSLMLPFHLACRYGSLDLVQYLFEQHPAALGEQTSDRNYNYYDDPITGCYKPILFNESNAQLLQVGNYPLHLAASREHSPEKIEIINFLLQQDPDAVSKVGKYGNLPLHRAGWYSSGPDIDTITALFQSLPTAIHTKNIFGHFPIHLAMSRGSNFDGLTFLAQQQPEALSVLDERGMSCAHYACPTKNALKKLKLIAEVFPEAFRCQSDSFGLPIHYACTIGCNKEVLQYLVAQYPESLAVHVGSIGSPLHCLEKAPLHWAKKAFVLRSLLEERYKTDVENGLPIVHAFLQDKYIQDKDRILALKPFHYSEDRAEEDFTGRTLSHLIFRFTNEFELITSVCYPSSLLSKQDRDGWLPLHHAMRHNASPEVLRFMLDGNPEHLQVTDNEGQTPFHVACRYDCALNTMKVLVEDNPELIRMRDNFGRTAVHHACQYGHSWKTIEFLLDGNMDLIETKDNKGGNIFHAACDGGAPLRVVRFLSKFTVLIPMADNEERTILHAACSGGASHEVVRYLVDELGCDTTAVDVRGDMALHKACRVGNASVIQYLMYKDNMTAVFARNNSNELPIHLLCNRSGKKNEVLESPEYVGAILKLLLAYPETVDQTNLA